MGGINTTSNVARSVIASIKVSDYTLLRDNNGWGHVSKKKCVFGLVSKWHIQKQENLGQKQTTILTPVTPTAGTAVIN